MTWIAASSFRPMRRRRISSSPAPVSNCHPSCLRTTGIGKGQSSSPMTRVALSRLSRVIECFVPYAVTNFSRAVRSATGSPELTICCPVGPSTFSSAFWSSALAASISAVTASSLLLKCSCAEAATDPTTSAALRMSKPSLCIVSLTVLPVQRQPLFPGHEFKPEPIIVDPQIPVRAAPDRAGVNLLHLLRHDANIGGAIAALVAEAIEFETVVEPPQGDDVLLEADVSTTPATATPTTATAAAPAMTSAAAHMTASATAASHALATAAFSHLWPAATALRFGHLTRTAVAEARLPAI